MKDLKTHPKLILAIIVIIIALAAATGLVWSKQLGSDDAKQIAPQQTTKKIETKTNPINYDGIEGKNALELLKTKASVITKQSSYGEYVDSVNGVQGGTDGKYWAFYVNDQMAQVGAADYQTKNGDKITWKFE